MDIEIEQRGVAPESDDEKKAERRWCFEMRRRLAAHRRHYHPSASLDINERAYQVARTISFEPGGCTWAKVLPEIIANREALDPAGWRYLLKQLKALAQAERELAAQAVQRAQRYEALVEQMDAPKHVSSMSLRRSPNSAPTGA